jgi:hypothetical protein
MVIHDAFKDYGLAVIGLHDASVRSIAEMDGKLAQIKHSLWMDHGLNFPVAIDSPGPAGSNDQGQAFSGATVAAYGIDRFPTAILIDPKGKILKR